MKDFEKLVKGVITAFNKLSDKCEHRNENKLTGYKDPDCHHPDLDFKCILCDPSNCPLLIKYNE